MKGIIAVLAVALAACGGGGGGSAVPVQATKAKTVLIEAYGDSTQYGITYQPGIGWTQNPYNAPYFLQVSLQAQFGAVVTVSNQGVSSTSGNDLLKGLDKVHPVWADQMAQSRAQIITINHMINDASLNSPEVPSDYKWILEQLVSTARQSGKIVVLEEPAPRCNTPENSAKLDLFQPVMKQVAQEMSVPIVENYDFVKSLPNWQAMEPDCIHPNADLYKIIADRENAVIAPLVKSLM